MKGELVAKVKFWFGKEYPIFDTKRYIIEQSEHDDNFFNIYAKQ